MKLRATRTMVKEYTPDKKWYWKDATEEDIIQIDKMGAESDPDLFFDDVDSDVITIEKVEE